jgi:hypothetical protein
MCMDVYVYKYMETDRYIHTDNHTYIHMFVSMRMLRSCTLMHTYIVFRIHISSFIYRIHISSTYIVFHISSTYIVYIYRIHISSTYIVFHISSCIHISSFIYRLAYIYHLSCIYSGATSESSVHRGPDSTNKQTHIHTYVGECMRMLQYYILMHTYVTFRVCTVEQHLSMHACVCMYYILMHTYVTFRVCTVEQHLSRLETAALTRHLPLQVLEAKVWAWALPSRGTPGQGYGRYVRLCMCVCMYVCI